MGFADPWLLVEVSDDQVTWGIEFFFGLVKPMIVGIRRTLESTSTVVEGTRIPSLLHPCTLTYTRIS